MSDDLVPGEIRVDAEPVTLNEGRETAEVTVGNTGDRPVQVGSHFHFFEANAALAFDREAAYGMRLNVPAGTAVRFEPGDERTVELVAIGGKRRASGMNGLVNGSVDGDPTAALQRAREAGFRDTGADTGATEHTAGDVDEEAADYGDPE
ncbi:urease subunit beta [Halobellus ruber]|uniref:Urease subunit beta n=1 Tax=Halobellus ruber TaxID=2761102 RepID=A0A7J9SGG5_9EURY|nr:urease subunit beta [Halobellus ruber]